MDVGVGGSERAQSLEFFESYGFVAIGEALGRSDIAHLNAWCDRTQQSNRAQWGVAERGATAEWLYHQPLLDYPELDRYVRHEGYYSLVTEMLGGEQHTRFSEFECGFSLPPFLSCGPALPFLPSLWLSRAASETPQLAAR